jgi:hypothetical protein
MQWAFNITSFYFSLLVCDTLPPLGSQLLFFELETTPVITHEF